MSFFRKDFPGRHAVILLTIAIMLLLIEMMDELYMETIPWVDLFYAIPIITAAVLLSPLETIGTGLLAMILCLTTQIESSDIEHLNMFTSIAIGMGGVLAAGKASLIRRVTNKLKASRDALNNSPIAYAEFRFPGYAIVSHNETFRQFVETAGGRMGKTLFKSLPEKISESIAGMMDKAVMEKERVDLDEFLLPTEEGKNSFWKTSIIPLQVGSNKTPRSVAMFAFNVTASVQRAHTQVAALKISSAVMSSLDLDNTIRVVLDNMAYIAETGAAALFLFEDDQWVGTAGYGDYSDELIMSMRYPYEELAAAVDAVESKKAMALTSPREISRSYQEMFNKLDAKSYLIVPLVSGNRTIGSIWLKHDDSQRRFSQEQIEFATAIGSHAALAIENATIYENEHFIRKSMEAIEAISEAGLVSLDLEEVLMEIVNRTQDVMKMDSALIFLVDNKRENLVPRAVTGAMREYASQIIIPVGEGIVGRTFKEGVPMKIDNLLSDDEERSYFAETDIHSVLTVPLRIGGMVEGVLEIACNREKAFSTREWGLFQVLADRASMAVQNSWAHEDTRKELDRVRLLRDVAAACAESQDMSAIAKNALKAVDEKMGCFRASVYYLDNERNALINLAFIGHSPKVMDEFKESPLDRGTLLTRAVLERRMITHEEVNLDNATEDEAYILKALNIGDNRRCTLPLIYKKEVVGGMALVFPDKYSFRPGEVQTILGVANQLAVAIHGSKHPVERSLEMLEGQTGKDPE